MAQHWVPQYILRGFSADGRSICQYDKAGELRPTIVAIKGACARNDAFSTPVERLLATIENAANPAIDVFRKMEQAMRIDPVAKRIVAVYLNTFLWRRSPAVRDRLVAETTEAALLDSAHDGAKRYGLPARLYHDRLPAIAAKTASDLNGLMAGYWESNTFQRWLLHSMSWSVLRCRKPIVFVPDRGLIQLGSRGLLDPKAEFYFPLSSKRVLVASWYGAPPDVVQFTSASPAHVRGINKHGFRQAGRFVYGLKQSEKVAETVQKSSHHFPTLEAIDIVGGTNPTAIRLDKLQDWYAEVVGKSDDPDRYCCIASGAREQCRHNWQRAPFDLPVVRETPEFKAPVGVCEWCGALEWRYPNGHVRFDDLELRRTTMTERLKNWWQSFKIVGTSTSIEAHGAVPRYRVTD